MLHECGAVIFTDFPQFFPTASAIIVQLTESDDIIISDREVRSNNDNSDTNSSVQGFRLRGSLNSAIEQTKNQMLVILGALVDIYDSRFADIIENPIYKAASVFLDTSSYSEMGERIIFNNMQEIVEKFHRHLAANGCKFDRLEAEFSMVITHVSNFFKHSSSRNTWVALFKKGNALGISNVLLVAQLGIVLPLGNAEAERDFSFLWRVFCKERSSLSNHVQEDLLRLRGSTVSNDFHYYARAIELFLTEYPNGNTRKRSRHLSGHSYPKERNNSKNAKIDVISSINDLVSSDESDISDISDNESSEEDENESVINLFPASDDSTDDSE